MKNIYKILVQVLQRIKTLEGDQIQGSSRDTRAHVTCHGRLRVDLHVRFSRIYPANRAAGQSVHLRSPFDVVWNIDVVMSLTASQITSLTIVYSTVYSGAFQRKHQSSASLAFVRGIHRGPVNSPHKWPVTRNFFPFDDVIMNCPRI